MIAIQKPLMIYRWMFLDILYPFNVRTRNAPLFLVDTIAKDGTNTQIASQNTQNITSKHSKISYNTKYMEQNRYQIPDEVNLDEKDRKILRLLIDEPRISVADIARRVGAQRDTVVYRMRRFEKKGLILKYHVVVDSAALGLDIFMLVLVKTAPVRQEKVDELVAGLMAHKNITHVAKLVGKYDFMLYMAAPDMVAFDSALSDLKSLGEGTITDIEPIGLSEAYKIDDFSALI